MTANEIKERLTELVNEVNLSKLPKTGELAFHQQRKLQKEYEAYQR